MVTRLRSGDVFGGYRIQAVAGRGGMGIVYRATELALDRPVALKLIAPGLADDAAFRHRFVRECKLAAALDHPNILPVYHAGEHDGALYLVSRFVEGDDLLAVIRREHLLPPRRAARIVAQVGAALDAAHARGLVHRDVKPANVLLTPDDHAYLADFGLTKRLHSVEPGTRPGAWVGTLDYVAPEQIRGEGVDARVDVYALGCVLFYILTGRVPFDREGDEAKLWAHLHDPPPAPSELAPGVPRDFDAVVGRAMAKSPDDRYPSAGSLGRAALAATGQDVDDADRTVPMETGLSDVTTAERTLAPARRALRRRRAWPAFGVVAGAGVVAAVLLSSGGSSPPTRATSTTTPPTPAPTPRPVPRRTHIIDVGFRPSSLTVARGDLWVVGFHRPTLTRIDGRRSRIASRPRGVPFGATVARAGYGAVWVTNSRRDSLTAIDLRTGKVRGPPTPITAGKPVGLAVGTGGVWVVAYGLTGDSVVRVDPHTRQVRAVIGGFRRRGLGKNIAVGKDGVWVVETHRRAAALIDPHVDKVTRLVPVGAEPKGIAVGAGFVWVANSGDNTVSQIAERSTAEGIQRVSVGVGHRPYDVAAGPGGVWVSNFGDHTVSRIDPRASQTAGSPIRVGRNPAALVLQGRTLWVASVGDDRIDRIDE
jgi:serine/threonine protein kinase